MERVDEEPKALDHGVGKLGFIGKRGDVRGAR